MSLLIDLAGGVIKAVSGVRIASRVAGLDTPTLDELHDGLSPVRAHARVERAHYLAANASAGQASQPTDPGDTGDGDPADADDGFISDVIQWITDLLTDQNRRDLAGPVNPQDHQIPARDCRAYARKGYPHLNRPHVKTTGPDTSSNSSH